MSSYEEFFGELNSSKNTKELIDLFDKYHIDRRDRKKYPDLAFNITKEEIDILKSRGIITTENNFNELLSQNRDLTALEKLLYAVIWKNGDLVKVRHIISGTCGEKTTSRVFNQFGQYLRDKNELIIDQHVIRAYIYYKCKKIIKKITNEDYDKYFDDYKSWIENHNLFKMNKGIIDELLFGVGKKMKQTDKD